MLRLPVLLSNVKLIALAHIIDLIVVLVILIVDDLLVRLRLLAGGVLVHEVVAESVRAAGRKRAAASACTHHPAQIAMHRLLLLLLKLLARQYHYWIGLLLAAHVHVSEIAICRIYLASQHLLITLRERHLELVAGVAIARSRQTRRNDNVVVMGFLQELLLLTASHRSLPKVLRLRSLKNLATLHNATILNEHWLLHQYILLRIKLLVLIYYLNVYGLRML